MLQFIIYLLNFQYQSFFLNTGANLLSHTFLLVCVATVLVSGVVICFHTPFFILKDIRESLKDP
jgi:hypothetical protein